MQIIALRFWHFLIKPLTDSSPDISLSQERVIENLRDQKEREDRVRLEELEQMRKENQELKDKLLVVQPQKLSQSQPVTPVPAQNQRLDGEVCMGMVLHICAVNNTWGTTEIQEGEGDCI